MDNLSDFGDVLLNAVACNDAYVSKRGKRLV